MKHKSKKAAAAAAALAAGPAAAPTAAFERIVRLYPAWDKRTPDPKTNYGVSGVELLMLLKGKKGAVQFRLFTNWQLPHVTDEAIQRVLTKAYRAGRKASSGSVGRIELSGHAAAPPTMFKSTLRLLRIQPDEQRRVLDQFDLRYAFLPMPTDLGYHSPEPRHEGQKRMTKSCEWLDGKPCYYDGSGLAAQRVFEVLLKEGDEGVWRELEAYYGRLFE